eukprot:8681423-Pyramimonas_sp.AAC.1
MRLQRNAIPCVCSAMQCNAEDGGGVRTEGGRVVERPPHIDSLCGRAPHIDSLCGGASTY